ncbi:LytR/AlgR family response regulator transcription factor [Maribacter sp. ACAM166]|uniref:LytR/AlgR family response regulator transcription factor n=1 Tax=Maribacter sp. ACAM166 TaxID=2508996 RepID=UPI0010FE8BAF|nr:LytTR family DNA-binding domain-containing protein [Maribacter sp. ACAM166]TLP76790.1 response regulator transcription factor [Maribacter sp. ACAM166]
MNCIIIDDEATARDVVGQLCSKIPELYVIEEFDNAISALKFLNKQTIDIVFLDIHMPGFSGVDFVQTLKDPPMIILTTSDTDFAITAYEYECIVDYLLKPITLERFEKSIKKINNLGIRQSKTKDAVELVSELGEELYINIDRRLIKIKFDEILIIQANGDYIDVKTEKDEYRVHTTLKKIKNKLPEKLFLQIHRSYIINFTKIIDIEDNSVLIAENVVPISRSSQPELRKRLNLL